MCLLKIVAEVIVEPLSAGTLKCSDSGGMMADDLDLSIEEQSGLPSGVSRAQSCNGAILWQRRPVRLD